MRKQVKCSHKIAYPQAITGYYIPCYDIKFNACHSHIFNNIKCYSLYSFGDISRDHSVSRNFILFWQFVKQAMSNINFFKPYIHGDQGIVYKLVPLNRVRINKVSLNRVKIYILPQALRTYG